MADRIVLLRHATCRQQDGNAHIRAGVVVVCRSARWPRRFRVTIAHGWAFISTAATPERSYATSLASLRHCVLRCMSLRTRYPMPFPIVLRFALLILVR